jgi:predicted AAA+ superfamily ATPase
MPDLHVVAAGSLLEFALQEIPSFGVGRIRSLFMYPLSFDEYLRAMGYEAMADMIKKASPDNPLSEAVHQNCLNHLVRFIAIGGMPEVVATYADGGSLLACQAVLDDLLRSFYDDFAKYKANVPVLRLRDIFASIVEQTGHKFKYSGASSSANNEQIKDGVNLLTLAGIAHPTTHTSANGIPLGAEANPKFRKYLLFDTGILQRFLNMDISKILLGTSLEQINKGSIAELFVGLELLKSAPVNMATQLYYWQRETRGSQAEVDYVIQSGNNILPIEVKSGIKGSMQSLFIYLAEKRVTKGIRTSFENFAHYQNIDVYPLYAISNII